MRERAELLSYQSSQLKQVKNESQALITCCGIKQESKMGENINSLYSISAMGGCTGWGSGGSAQVWTQLPDGGPLHKGSGSSMDHDRVHIRRAVKWEGWEWERTEHRQVRSVLRISSSYAQREVLAKVLEDDLCPRPLIKKSGNEGTRGRNITICKRAWPAKWAWDLDCSSFQTTVPWLCTRSGVRRTDIPCEACQVKPLYYGSLEEKNQ